jgi:hypothetical protein
MVVAAPGLHGTKSDIVLMEIKNIFEFPFSHESAVFDVLF